MITINFLLYTGPKTKIAKGSQPPLIFMLGRLQLDTTVTFTAIDPALILAYTQFDHVPSTNLTPILSY